MVNLGRRFKDSLRQAVEMTSSSKVGDNQEGETREDDPSPHESYNETDYNKEKYPPTDEKYKQLEERLSSMDFQKVPGLDFEELGLVSWIVILPKFKVPVFAKYDGVSCPKIHL